MWEVLRSQCRCMINSYVARRVCWPNDVSAAHRQVNRPRFYCPREYFGRLLYFHSFRLFSGMGLGLRVIYRTLTCIAPIIFTLCLLYDTSCLLSPHRCLTYNCIFLTLVCSRRVQLWSATLQTLTLLYWSIIRNVSFEANEIKPSIVTTGDQFHVFNPHCRCCDSSVLLVS